MMNRYLKIDLDDVQPEMRLWEPVLDGRGETLLPAGTVLNASILTSLRRRGIDVVVVENDDISESELRLERERLEKRLAILFRRCNGATVSRTLWQSVLEYRLGAST